MKKLLGCLLLGMLIFAGCSSTEFSTVENNVEILPLDVEEQKVPVYVTFAGHIEDRKMYIDCDVYEKKSEDLLKVAEMVKDSGIAFNLQASYEWFMGAESCDPENLMNRLVEDFDFEIDVHQEGASEELDDVTSGNNLADIRFIAAKVTDYVSDSTGFQWDNPAQYDRLQYGETGRLHDFTWHPNILTGGVSVSHTNGDFSRDMTSIGVWIPSGFTEDEFHLHDESKEAHMVYVGSGPNQFMDDWGSRGSCHFKSSADFVGILENYIEPDGIYTYTVFVPQKVMFEESGREELQLLIDEFLELQEAGQVIFAHHTEVVDIWREDFDSNPTIFTYDQIDPEDYTCEG